MSHRIAKTFRQRSAQSLVQTGVDAQMRKAALVTLAALLISWTASAEEFDIVLKGGRVVDPETGLDAIRVVGLLSVQAQIFPRLRIRDSGTLHCLPWASRVTQTLDVEVLVRLSARVEPASM